MKHLIDPMDLTVEEIDELLDLADDIIENREQYSKKCEGKKLATLFF
jgi:aspartate carbamoyltransferase catalytic subunit